ncbi:MAG: c-type cytochrome [Polyangiaceae bacterium]
MDDEQDTPAEDRVVHVYDDDIVELDNRLPLWWQYTLYGAIVFAGVYWYGEMKLGAWKSRAESYDQEMVAARIAEAQKGGPMSPEALVAMSHDPKSLEAGKALFTSTCAACHKADGSGTIGPNLTDGFWLHGSKPANIYTTVHDGVSSKGMPAWGPQLGNEKVADAVAYVLTLKDTNVAGGKAPQGESEP